MAALGSELASSRKWSCVIAATAAAAALISGGCVGILGGTSGKSPSPSPLAGLTSNASSLVFGRVNVGSSNTLVAMLTNSGTANLTVSGLTTVGQGLTASGVAGNSV